MKLPVYCAKCLDDCEEEVPATSFCKTCNENFCENHTLFHNKSKKTKDHINQVTPIVGSTTKSSVNAICPIHQLEFEEFCRDCDEIICAKCFAKNHKNHNVVTIDDVADEEKKKTISLIDNLTKQLKDWEVNCNGTPEELEKEIITIKEKGDKCQHEIDDHFNKLIQQLQKRREELTNELKTIVDEKLKLINDFKTLQKEMNEVTVNKVDKMSNYEMIDYQLKVLKKLQKETKELLQNQQSIQNLHQFEIINLKEQEMNEMINQIGKINQKVICPKYCQLIEMNFKNNNDVYCGDIVKFKIQLKDYNNEIIQLDDNLLKSYSLQCYLKEIDSDNKLIELQKEVNENNYNIEMTIPEIENDKKVEFIVLINNYQIIKLSLNIIVTKYEWDNSYLPHAQLLNGNELKKIYNYWNSYKLTPIIKLTNNIQTFKFKIDKESNYYTWFGICDVTNQFNNYNCFGNDNGNNLEFSFGSYSSLSCISNYNAGKGIKNFYNVNYGTGDTIIIQLKRGKFILINETRFKNQPCICEIPQQMESVHLAVSLREKDSQITFLN